METGKKDNENGNTSVKCYTSSDGKDEMLLSANDHFISPSESAPVDDFQSRSKDTCQIVSPDLLCFDTPVTSLCPSQDIENSTQVPISSKDVAERISRESIKVLPDKNVAPCSFTTPSTSIDEHTRDTDTKVLHHQDSITKICENLPPNIAEIVSQTLSAATCVFENNRISEVTKEFFQQYAQDTREVITTQSSDEKVVQSRVLAEDIRVFENNRTSVEFIPLYDEQTCEVSTTQSSNENLIQSESSLSACAYQQESGGRNIESATCVHTCSDSTVHPWDRPGSSKQSEYNTCKQCENDKGSKAQIYYKTYPGLSLQPLRVKKDANYQKKFYRQKKEIVLPEKACEIIRWAVKVSKHLAHDVPEVPSTDEDKLPLDKYHDLAQELVQGFIAAYNSTKEAKSKHMNDESKKSVERKRLKKERKKAGYVESSFQEESPSDSSDNESSRQSQEVPLKTAASPASISKPPSETNLSMVDVSPVKPTMKVSPVVVSQPMKCQPSSHNLETSEPEVKIISSNIYDYGKYASEEFPFQPVKIQFIDLDQSSSCRRIIYCRNNLMSSSTEQDTTIKLKAFFRIVEVIKPITACLPISVEEFLQNLLITQGVYYEMLYDESSAFYRFRNYMTRCVIPLRIVKPDDDDDDQDYELEGDTLKPGTSLSKVGHALTPRNFCSNVVPSTPRLQTPCPQGPQRDRTIYIQDNLRTDNEQQLRQINEGKSPESKVPKDININVCDIAYDQIEIPITESVCKIVSVQSLCKDTECISRFPTESNAAESEEEKHSKASQEELQKSQMTGTESDTENSTLINLEQSSTETVDGREFPHFTPINIFDGLVKHEKPLSAATSIIDDSTDEQSNVLRAPRSSPTGEISDRLAFKNIFEEEQRAILESLKKSLSETSNKEACSGKSGVDQREISEASQVRPFAKKTLNKRRYREIFEEEQRAILESLKKPLQEETPFKDISAISVDSQREILESYKNKSPSKETLSRRSFKELFEVEQRAILESIHLHEQSNNPEDVRNWFSSTECKEPSKKTNTPETYEGKPTSESSTCEIPETKSRIETEYASTGTETLSKENITNSFQPTIQVEPSDEDICHPPGLTQFPIIVNLREKDKYDSKRKEVSFETDRPSTSGTDSVFEKKNLPRNMEMELSPDSLNSNGSDTDSFSTSHEDKSENTKDT